MATAIVWHMSSGSTLPSYVGNPIRNGYQGTTTPYKIEGGKVVTKVRRIRTPSTIYKLGDTYYGARSNEFGYANYEMIPSPQFVVNPLTAMLNQFSIELGLTEQQQQQILPYPARREFRSSGAEEEHLAQATGQIGAVEANQRRRRCQNHASPRSAAAAEVPGHPRRASAGDDREDGGPGCRQKAEAFIEASRAQ